MELNETTTEQQPIVSETPNIAIEKPKTKKNVKPTPKDFSQMREMNQQEVNDAFFRVQKIISEVGNRALDFDNNQLFDTCVIVLKQMNLYTKYSKK